MNLSYLHGDVVDHEALPLPQPGLFADLDAGVGTVGLSDEFRTLPAVARLAILVAWQKGMENERRMAVASLFQEVTESMVNLDLPKKLEHFRAVCGRLGISCPVDVAILLQQV
jgi:hypothetical protein